MDVDEICAAVEAGLGAQVDQLFSSFDRVADTERRVGRAPRS